MNDPKNLSSLYLWRDIDLIWQECRSAKVIKHPKLGRISPNEFRAIFADTPCPFCGHQMRQGVSASTKKKSEAIARGYEYLAQNGKKTINQAGKGSKKIYFHPHYVSLDHKLNKARFPEKIFDSNNLQAICWKCNREKGDNNAYKIQNKLSIIKDIEKKTLTRFSKL